MTNKTYDTLKYLALVILPALAVLVKTVFPIWNIPYGDDISLTIMAVDTFMGAVLKVSSDKYKMGRESE